MYPATRLVQHRDRQYHSLEGCTNRCCELVGLSVPVFPRHQILLLAGDLRGGHRTSQGWKEHWPRHLIWVFTLVLLHTLGGPWMST